MQLSALLSQQTHLLNKIKDTKKKLIASIDKPTNIKEITAHHNEIVTLRNRLTSLRSLLYQVNARIYKIQRESLIPGIKEEDDENRDYDSTDFEDEEEGYPGICCYCCYK